MDRAFNWLRCTTRPGQRLFKLVIVITDRPCWISSLQDTSLPVRACPGGVVKQISNRETSTPESSQSSCRALAEQTRIIIVTIQTFPGAVRLLWTSIPAGQRTLSVSADEASLPADGLIGLASVKQILWQDAPRGEAKVQRRRAAGRRCAGPPQAQ